MTVARQATLADGRRAEWHDDLGTVGRYRIVNADGTVASERDYDAFEQGQRSEDATRRTQTTNQSTLINEAKAAVLPLRQSLTKLTTARGRTDNQLAGNTAATATALRGLMDELILAERAIVAVARVVGQELASTDTGPA